MSAPSCGQHMPYSVVESRALLQDLELPLWNRYNSSGVTLLGQGQSMFGDPLHIFVILTGGASWAWDIKYLLAKMLFTAGLGLAVYTTTRHLACVTSPGVFFSLHRLFFFSFQSSCFFQRLLRPVDFVVLVQNRPGADDTPWHPLDRGACAHELDGDEQWYGQGSLHAVSILKPGWSAGLSFVSARHAAGTQKVVAPRCYRSCVCSAQHADLAHILGRLAAIVYSCTISPTFGKSSQVY